MDPPACLVEKSKHLQGEVFPEPIVRQMVQYGEGKNPIEAISERDCQLNLKRF